MSDSPYVGLPNARELMEDQVYEYGYPPESVDDLSDAELNRLITLNAEFKDVEFRLPYYYGKGLCWDMVYDLLSGVSLNQARAALQALAPAEAL